MIKSVFPYVIFNGDALEAIKFYESAIGAEVVSVKMFGDMPSNPDYSIPEAAKSRVLNAQLKIGDQDLMISDTFPGPHEKEFKKGGQVSIALVLNDVAMSEEIFHKLKVDGEITMELQKTFWSPSYGQLIDRFGVQWQISVELDE